MKRLIYLLLLPLAFISCNKEDEPEQFDANKVKRTVLVYAVNKSSLSFDFTSDMREMLQGVSSIDLKEYQLLLFQTDSETTCGLYTATMIEDTGKPAFTLVKRYDRDRTSTHPDRITEVISDALSLYPNSAYDLIFWGHGMSWKPYFTDHVVDQPADYAYGGEYTGGTTSSGNKETDWTEIDELADCVPDNTFQTIWFDCCYMTGIEVIYEFRDKCKTFVGYPSEVWSYGLAYDLILPYLLRSQPDVTGAARAFYEYYNADSSPVTVAVIDMSRLEEVADAARAVIHSGSARPNSSGLLNYSRTAGSPFYDFRQFFTSTAELNGASEASKAFDEAADRMIVYHAESTRNFSLRPWDYQNISGVSTHFYQNGLGTDEAYYETLDWFKRVYK